MRVLVSLFSDACLPNRAHKTDAGLDLKAFETICIDPSECVLVGTGVHAAIPDGSVGLLVLRSGFAFKNPVVLANGVGIIDSGYRGEIKFAIRNIGTECVIIEAGTRLGQLVVLPCLFPEIEVADTLPESERGDGGFGSTGK